MSLLFGKRDGPRPRIGVTVSARSAWRIFPLIRLQLALAGGKALRWIREDEVDLDKVDGVVIGGGDDIAPMLYGGEVRAGVTLDPARDRMESRVIEKARGHGLPVLGICRGAQMLNVVLGGTLHQDAFEVYDSSRRYRTILPRREVEVLPGTRLADLAGTEPMKVNALHSQAVNRLGDGLRLSARDQGGMPQALESLSDPFAIGVQWHPEHLVYARRQRRIFRALVSAARARQKGLGQMQEVDRMPAVDAPTTFFEKS